MSSTTVYQTHSTAVSWAALEKQWCKSCLNLAHAGGVGCCWCQGSTAEENVSLYKLGTQPRALSLPVSQENLSKYEDKPETMRLVTCRIHSNQVLPLLFTAWGTYLKKPITLNFCYRFISPFCTLVSLWEEEFSEVFQSLGSTCGISQVFPFILLILLLLKLSGRLSPDHKTGQECICWDELWGACSRRAMRKS